MFLLILTHVNTGHQRFVIEQVFCQCLCQFGLTYTGGAKEDERADGAFRVLQSCTAPAHGVCYGFDGFVLSDNTFVQFVFQMEQLVAFALQHLAYRYSRPARYYIGYILGSYLFLNHGVVALLFLQVFLDALDFVFQCL